MARTRERKRKSNLSLEQGIELIKRLIKRRKNNGIIWEKKQTKATGTKTLS